MAERIFIKNSDPTQFSASVAIALRYLNAGEVIIVAAEHGYVYLANAFDQEGVAAINILRGNKKGVTLQVLIGNQRVMSGLAPAITVSQKLILDTFWPGLLSVTVSSQPGLTWNLGDDRRLGKVNLRVPNRKFINAILDLSGPLATSTAALIGTPTILDLSKLPIYESDVGAIFDEGILDSGLPSTWLEFSEDEITVQRVGAITLDQLQALIPSISTPNL